jgi:hypothetical protein
LRGHSAIGGEVKSAGKIITLNAFLVLVFERNIQLFSPRIKKPLIIHGENIPLELPCNNPIAVQKGTTRS